MTIRPHASARKLRRIKMSDKNFGTITAVMGPVVDVSFEGAELPPLNTALTTTNSLIEGGQENNLVLEVALHLGDHQVSAIAMDTTDGLVRGARVLNTGKPISVPVCEGTLGRILNVTGEPIEGDGAVNAVRQ